MAEATTGIVGSQARVRETATKARESHKNLVNNARKKVLIAFAIVLPLLIWWRSTGEAVTTTAIEGVTGSQEASANKPGKVEEVWQPILPIPPAFRASPLGEKCARIPILENQKNQMWTFRANGNSPRATVKFSTKDTPPPIASDTGWEMWPDDNFGHMDMSKVTYLCFQSKNTWETFVDIHPFVRKQ